MKKYKLKLIVQSKTSVEDSPTTHQFISGVYSDSSEVLPDIIDFLKTVSDNSVVELDTGAMNLDLNVGELELPVFDRLYKTAVSAVEAPVAVQPEAPSVSALEGDEFVVADATDNENDVPDENIEGDTKSVVSDNIVGDLPSDNEQVETIKDLPHEPALSDFDDDILPNVESDEADDDSAFDNDRDSVYDFES